MKFLPEMLKIFCQAGIVWHFLDLEHLACLMCLCGRRLSFFKFPPKDDPIRQSFDRRRRQIWAAFWKRRTKTVTYQTQLLVTKDPLLCRGREPDHSCELATASVAKSHFLSQVQGWDKLLFQDLEKFVSVCCPTLLPQLD